MITLTLWIFIAYFALSILVTIGTIGKDRKPVTPEIATATVLIMLCMIGMLVTALVRG